MNMDAVKFISEHKRMCESFGTSCNGCPLHGHPCTFISSITNGDCKRILVKVEQWSKEHPIKTRQSELLRVIPNLRLDKNGSIFLCPATITGNLCGVYSNKHGCDNCYDCRKNFWNQEVE